MFNPDDASLNLTFPVLISIAISTRLRSTKHLWFISLEVSSEIKFKGRLERNRPVVVFVKDIQEVPPQN